MDPQASGIVALFNALLRDLSFPGKLAAFFGALLTLVGAFATSAPYLFSGLALLLIAVANYYWQNRYIGVSFGGEQRRWHAEIIWSNLFLCLLFLACALVSAYYWWRLPAVAEFLRAAGIP